MSKTESARFRTIYIVRNRAKVKKHLNKTLTHFQGQERAKLWNLPEGGERHPQIVPGDGGTGPPSPPAGGGKKGVKDPYHSEASLPGRSTVAGRIFEEEAGLGRDARPFRRQTVESRVPLFYSQLSGGVDGLKAVQKAVVLQGGAAQGGGMQEVSTAIRVPRRRQASRKAGTPGFRGRV